MHCDVRIRDCYGGFPYGRCSCSCPRCRDERDRDEAEREVVKAQDEAAIEARRKEAVRQYLTT